MTKQQTADCYELAIKDYEESTARLIAYVRKEKARIITKSADLAIITPIYQLVAKHGICTIEPDYGQFSGEYYDEQYEYEDREYNFTFGNEGLIGLVIKNKKEK